MFFTRRRRLVKPPNELGLTSRLVALAWAAHRRQPVDKGPEPVRLTAPLGDDVSRSMPYWAAIKTLGQRESFAAESAALAGFEVFLPRVRALVGARWKTGPLFPDYVFVRIVDRWRILERTIGVVSVVRCGETPARCPDSEIAALLARTDPDGIVRLATQPSPQPVRRAFARRRGGDRHRRGVPGFTASTAA